jgi:hypothetical protein
MTSSYTSNTGIEKPATGDQSGTWGDTVNVNMDIIDRVLNGVGAISLSGTTHTITTSDGSLSDGMYRVLVLGGSPSGTNTITVSPNDQDKVFFVKNGSGQSVVFTQGSGANVTIANGDTKIIYCDGAGSGAAVVDFTNDLSMSSVSITGGTVTGITINSSAIGGSTPAAGAFTTLDATGDVTGANFQPDGDTAAGDDAAIGYTSAEGLILTGQGSTNDVTIKNDADADVLEIPTGTTNVTVVGNVTAGGNLISTGTVEPAGDTAAGDNAAIGYTSVEGLILTGQGSTNDVTIKNDADADVIEIPTGTTDVTVVGKFTGGKIVLAATDTDTSNTGSVTIDFSAHQNFVLTLTGNTTLANPSTEAVGQAGVFVFIQDGTGSRTLSLGTDYESPAGAGIVLSTAAAAVDVVPYFVKASGSIQLGAPQLAFS